MPPDTPRTYEPTQTGLRIWTVDAPQRQAGDGKNVEKGGKFVPAGIEIPWKKLREASSASTGDREVSLYIEYVENGATPSLAGQQQEIEVIETVESGSIAIDRVTALPVVLDLSVDNNDQLSGEDDGITRYLPGYKGDQPMLHIGTSFENAAYDGPQEMKIILQGLGASVGASLVTAEIPVSTAHPGYCGNGSTPSSPVEGGAGGPEADVSFEPGGNVFSTTSATVTADNLSVPVYCKDYGAYAYVSLNIKVGATTLPTDKFGLMIPNDPSEDKFADHWQNDQIDAWNKQYVETKRKTIGEKQRVLSSGSDALLNPVHADYELEDSDGTGPSVAMANYGDGLNTLKEYRGYILDGGPDVPLHLHKRLSLARKELLVECSEMGGITAGGNQVTVNGQIQVNTEVQSYDLEGLMSRVSEFYRRDSKGGVIDLYWVRDRFDDTTQTYTFTNGQSYPAYKRDGTFELKVPPVGGTPPTTIAKEGWLTLTDNVWLESVSPQDWENLYGGVATKSPPSGLGASSRNPRCEDLVKLMVLGRLGFVDGNGDWRERFINADGLGTAGTFNRKNAKDPKEEVSFLFVNSIAEYTTYSSPDLFLDELAYATAHEIAHLILLGGGGLDEDGHRMGQPASLMGEGKQLSPLIFHEDEIRNINLPGRSSVLP